MRRKILFNLTGSIESLATIKRAFGHAPYLHELGYEVHLLLENTPENYSRAATEAPRAILHSYSTASAWQEIRSKHRLINQIRPDYIYSMCSAIRCVVFPFLLEDKTALRMVEYSELPAKNFHSGPLRRSYEALMDRLCLRMYRHYIFASKYLYYFFEQKYNVSKGRTVSYLPYAYEPRFYFRKERTGSQGPFHLMHLGSLEVNYGFLFIIAGVQQLIDQGHAVRLTIMGDGRDRHLGEAYVRQHGLEHCVDFAGFVAEASLNDRLNEADAFIAPLLNTIQDKARCPSKMFLYLPYLKPIITAKIGEGLELFENRGNYYQPSDADSFRKAVLDCLNGRAFVLTDPAKHTWQARTTQLLADLPL